jgi:hypothetical protein
MLSGRLRGSSRIPVAGLAALHSSTNHRWAGIGTPRQRRISETALNILRQLWVGPASVVKHRASWLALGKLSRSQPTTRFMNASILAVADFDKSFGKSVKPCAPPG